MLLATITLITALTISSVAIYYSVAGLTAIFSAAVIPIIIMGGALEIGKLVSAIWLHRHWSRAKWWLKTYLVSAVCVLMMITSMGIFGFLSKAHIEQTAEARQIQEKVEQIKGEIKRQKELISAKESQIENLKVDSNKHDQRLSKKIKQETQEIQKTRKRYEKEIKEQRNIISARQKQNQERIDNLKSRISSIKQNLDKLQTLLNNRKYAQAQAMVGTVVDNDYGPNTADAVKDYRNSKKSQIEKLRNKIKDIRTNDPVIQDARKTIAKLKKEKRNSIENSEDLIDRLEKKQFSEQSSQETQKQVDQIRQEISKANQKIEDLTQKKYNSQDQYRKFEAEVGPIKYIAEFIYGKESDRSSLEDAVRWVIVMIIFVFDPLAVLLLISSQEAVRMSQDEKEKFNNKGSDGPDVKGGYQPTGPGPDLTPKDPPKNENTNKKKKPKNAEINVNENSEYNNITKSQDKIVVTHNYEFGVPLKIDTRLLEDEHVKKTRDQENNLNTEKNQSNKENQDFDDSQNRPSLNAKEAAQAYINQDFVSENDFEKYKDSEPEKKDTKYSEKHTRLTKKDLKDLDQDVHWDKAKRFWKEDNPERTIKYQKNLYLKGAIDEFPWESYLSQENRDLSKKKLNSKNNTKEKVQRYIQNGEQEENTLWAKIREKNDR